MKKIKVIRYFYKKDILAHTITFYAYAKTDYNAVINILQKEIIRYPYNSQYDTVETHCIGISNEIGITDYLICKAVAKANTRQIEWYRDV